MEDITNRIQRIKEGEEQGEEPAGDKKIKRRRRKDRLVRKEKKAGDKERERQVNRVRRSRR